MAPRIKRRDAAQMTALAVVSVLAALVFSAPAAQARYSPRAALNDLNVMRGATGMPRVSGLRTRWNRGCRLHNRYMRRTGIFGHYESRSSRYYTRAGAHAAERSVIAQPSQLPSRAFGDTIYHRLALLQPRLRSIGYASSSGFTCINVLAGVRNALAPQTTVYAYPANNATGLDPVFNGGEWPDPLQDAPGAEELGTPITGSVNGPWKNWMLARSYVNAASLISELGESIPVSASDANSPNGQFLQGGFALLPRRGLPENTWFTARASGSVRYQGQTYPFTLLTRFQTSEDF